MRAAKTRSGGWALVTGASSGLGEAFALALAAAGSNVVLVARRIERLESLAARIRRDHAGVDTRIVAADLSDAEAIESLIAATDDVAIDLLVCNAGAASTGDFLALPRGALLRNFDLNARVNLALCHHFGDRMVTAGGGGIIVVSSIVGFTGVAGWTAYAAAKSGGIALALGLADELAGRGVHVQALCPGHVRTEFHEQAGIRALWPMEPARVVRTSLGALGRRRLVIPGLFNKFCVFGLRFLPHAWGARLYGGVLHGLRGRPRA